MMRQAIRAGIAGFRGYSGAELVRLLQKHPCLEVVLLEHRSDSASQPLPLNARAPLTIPCSPHAVRSEQLGVVFLATPAEVSMELAPDMLDAGAKVIDLSGAFRLGSAENFRRWYKTEHTAPGLMSTAVYGLPEMNRAQLTRASLISNPGCYPTAANLAIQPLVEAGVIDLHAGVVCDAKSGVSGAGRKASLTTSFCEVAENLTVYSAFDHRHVPEVLMISGLQDQDFTFTAQLLPIDRGILETIYFRTRAVRDGQELLDIYERRYQGEPFVRLYPLGGFPDIRAAQRTNYCDLGVRYDPASGRAIVVSVIDNLGKGAAGQAIQNMNLALGCRETEGLV